MTEADVIEHWRKGSLDALEMAKAALDLKKYDHVLFNCHLAVEKALKAQYMQEHNEEAPYSHDLFLLAKETSRSMAPEQDEQLAYLTAYAVAARYADPPWAQREANEENSKRWIGITEKFLSFLCP